MATLHSHRRPARAAGFTLVEAVIVIVITGIVAAMTAVFIRVPVQSYLATEARADMSDAADLAMRRMSRELRLALPNSVNVKSNPLTIQFLLTKTGGRYIDINDGPPATLLPLDFATHKTQFDLVGDAPSGRTAIVPGDYIAIYNLGTAPADAYLYGAGSDNVARVASVAGSRVTLQSNPFATTTSPNFRFQVVTGTVTYVCVPGANGTGTLRRYFSRNIVKGVDDMAALGNAALLSQMIDGCNFSYAVLPGQDGGGLVTMMLALRSASGETARLVRQAKLDNIP